MDPTVGELTLVQAQCDTCVWVIKANHLLVGWLITYVDDILAVAKDTSGRTVIGYLMQRWKLSEIEILSEEHPEMGFLGTTLRFVPGKGYFVHQRGYKWLIEAVFFRRCQCD